MRNIIRSQISLLGLVLGGCAAPRSVLWDGTCQDRWHVDGQVAMTTSLPTATIGAVSQSQMDLASDVIRHGGDSLFSQDRYDQATRTLVAGALDMPGASVSAEAHLGIGWGMDIGYRRESGANAWSLRRQFLKFEEDGWNLGAGIQYSSQDYELPSALGKVQSLLGYRFERKDVMVPVVLSKPIGEKGQYGSAGFGLVGGWTKVVYGFDPQGLYRTWGHEVALLENLPDQETTFLSGGGSGILRLGYRKVFGVVGMTILYQDYGTYKVPARDPISLSGLSILPSAGIELRL